MADPLASAAVTGVTPGSLVQGEAGAVQITGNKTNFDATSVVSFSSAGITASGVTATSATVLSATLNVAPATPVGASDVTVTTGAEVAPGTGKFTVEAAPPATIFVSPDSKMRGLTTAVDINGQETHFGDSSVVSFAGAGITVSAVTVFSGTTLRATITIDPFAPLGASGVTVTTGSEHATGGVFTVDLNPALVKVTGVSPSSAVQDTADLTVQITGQQTHFDATSVVSFAGAGIEISAFSLVSATSMEATISIGAGAYPGPSDVTVTTGAEVAHGVGVFSVLQNPTGPLIASVAPASGAQGDVLRVEINGGNTHFDETSAVAFSGAGIAISDLSVAAPTTIRVTATIDAAAPSGVSDVTVTTGTEVATGVGAFKVIASVEKAEALREAVNTYLRLVHVTDPAAVAVCEQFIASINDALRGQAEGSGVMITVSATPPPPVPPDRPRARNHHASDETPRETTTPPPPRDHGRHGRNKS